MELLAEEHYCCFPRALEEMCLNCFHENSRNPQTSSGSVVRLLAFLQDSAAKNHVFRHHLPAFPCHR